MTLSRLVLWAAIEAPPPRRTPASALAELGPRALRLLRARLAAPGGATPPAGEAGPLGAQPRPRLLELAASHSPRCYLPCLWASQLLGGGYKVRKQCLLSDTSEPRSLGAALLTPRLGAQELLRSGVGVLYAAPHAVLLSPPAASLHADSDLETLSHGWEEDDVRGHIFGSDDPPMGWGRYAERGLADPDPDH